MYYYMMMGIPNDVNVEDFYDRTSGTIPERSPEKDRTVSGIFYGVGDRRQII
ncbi:MAG: hypothetical protein ACLUAR_04775 [Pilosibacter sp.]